VFLHCINEFSVPRCTGFLVATMPMLHAAVVFISWASVAPKMFANGKKS